MDNLKNLSNLLGADGKGFSPEMFQNLMNPRDPVTSLKPFMAVGNANIVEPMLEKVDMLKFGGDLLHLACAAGKKDIVELLISKGADVMNPPERVHGEDSYRRAPFVLQAVASGDAATLALVQQHGGSLTDSGFIGLSKKRKNLVISNVIGCAAWHGSKDLLEDLAKRLGKDYIDVEAMEQADKHAKAALPFKKELARYTPLLLAVAKSDDNLECAKSLLKFGANVNVTDDYGNTVLHVAALNGNNRILDYIAKNLKINMFGRNSEGETALNICATLKNAEGVQILGQYQEEYDKSKDRADDLLAELGKEEEQDEEAKARRRQKKWRNKINRIAKAEKISPEEVEARLEKEAEEKRVEEERKAKEESEREVKEQQAAAKRKEDLKRQREELKRQEEAEARAEAAERRRLEEEERQADEERRRERAAKRERHKSAARQEGAKERDHQPREAAHEEARSSLRKERVKSMGRQAHQEEKKETPHRQPRYQEKAGTQAEAQEDRRKSKSVRRGVEDAALLDNKLEVQDEAQHTSQIVGLGGEMLLAATSTSKKAQQRLKKRMRKQQEEEDEQRARVVQVAEERAAQQVAKAEEDRKRAIEERKAEKLRKLQAKIDKKKAEDEERAQKEAAAATKEVKHPLEELDAQDDKKKQKRAKTARATKEVKEEKPALVYRAKPAAGGPATEAAEATPTPTPKAAAEKPVEQTQPKAEQIAPKEPRAKPESAKQSTKKEKSQGPKQAQPAKQAPAEKHEEAKATGKAQQSKQAEAVVQPAKAKPAQPAAKVQESSSTPQQEAPKASGISEDVAALQRLLMAKEKEIGRLQKHIDKQDAKAEGLGKENGQLRDQLKLSSEGDQLKKAVTALNEQLSKQTALNRLQASQILEFEQALWQANKQREEVETKLYDQVQNGRSAPTPADGTGEDADLLFKANQEIRVKSVQAREMQGQIEAYQGKATRINALSKAELTDLREELTAALHRVEVATNDRSKTAK